MEQEKRKERAKHQMKVQRLRITRRGELFIDIRAREEICKV